MSIGNRKYIGLVISLIFLSIMTLSFPVASSAEETIVKVGVLANRGYDQCRKRWEPTMRYLTKKVSPYEFRLVPLGFDEMMPAVRDRKIDFVIVNSSNFVDIEAMYGATGIATIKTRLLNSFYTVFGGVIFTRSDNQSIKALGDLKGKSFIAADRESLGGWQVQWRELKRAGIDPDKDLSQLRFAGQHDAAVFEVLSGRADAGACRTDVLENLANAGKIKLADIRVIGEGGDVQNAKKDFPYLLSTRLYPEWPFAKLSHTSPNLASRVSLALQTMKEDEPAAIAGENGGWSYPLNYQSVHDLQMELQIGYYKKLSTRSLQETVRKYWREIVIVILVFMIITMALFLVTVLYRRLSELHRNLDNELKERDKIEMALRESKSQLDLALASARMGTWLLDLSSGKRFFDDQVCRLLGIDPATFQGTADEFFKFIHPEDREKVREALARTLDQDVPYGPEYRVVLPDGDIRFIAAQGMLIRDQDGKPEKMNGVAWDNTERKRMEEALRESEEKYRLLIDNSHDIIYTLTADGIFTFVSPSWTVLLGHPVSQVVGKPFEPFVHADDLAGCMAWLQKVVETGQRQEGIEYRVRHTDGTWYWHTSSAVPLRDETSAIIGVVGTARDITKRKQVEAALRESEERYRSIFENAREGIYQITPEGRFIRVNQAMARMWGYDSPEEMMAKVVDVEKQHYVNPQGRALFKASMDEQGSVEGLKVEIYRKDRSRIWVSLNARVARDENGKLLYYEGTNEDITDQKLMEDMIRENERRYRHLVENSNDIIYTTDLRGVLTYVNPVAERVTGYAVSQLFGKHFHQVVRADYHEQIDKLYEEQLLEKTPANYFEFPIVLRDGSEKWIGQQVQLIFEQDKAVGFQATARDITDRLKVEEEQREREKLSAIVETAGMVCHEMNQPMQVILGHAELLSMTMKEDDPLGQRLDTIREQIMKMSHITRKLMNMTRYKTKPYVGESRIVDLDESAD